MTCQLRLARAVLLIAGTILTSYGLIVLHSTTLPLPSGSALFNKQIVWLVVALVSGIFFAFINLNRLKSYAKPIGILTLLLLLSVLIPGVSRCVKGAHRWIELGGLRVQPSEPAKVGFVLFFAYFLCYHVHQLKSFARGFLQPISVLGVFCFLLILEPDFGTTALFGCVGALMLFAKGVRLRFIIPTSLLALVVFGIAIYFNPVRLNRILAFLDLDNNRLTGAYQLWQSLIAFSSGGWWGCGLGQGRQQFFFLPEAHTDFIGAILAEELGIFHMLIVLLCFVLIAYFGLKITQAQYQPYLFFIGLGTVCFISIQVILNLGIITGVLPTKGLALPFLSYGGSNLVTNFCFIGLLVNLTRPIYSPLNDIQK